MFRKLHEPTPDMAGLVTLQIDGQSVQAQQGESVAAVMLRQPEIWVRTTPVSGARRAPYCMMGVCFDCLAIIDGVASVQTCMTQVADGMRVERQRGRRGLSL